MNTWKNESGFSAARSMMSGRTNGSPPRMVKMKMPISLACVMMLCRNSWLMSASGEYSAA